MLRLRLHLLLLVTLASPGQSQAVPLFRAAAPIEGRASQAIQVDLDLLRSLPEELRFDLPDGRSARATRVFAERRPDGLVWRGRQHAGLSAALDAPNAADVVLTLHGELLIGRILAADVSWSIQPRGNGHEIGSVLGLAALRRNAIDGETAAASLPAPCAGTLTPDRELIAAPEASSGGSALQGIDSAMGGPRLDVMVAYTSRASAELGNSRLQAEARAAVDYLELSLTNSGVTGRARLVETVAAPQLDGLRSQDEGLPALRVDPTINAQRDAVQADVVVLFMASSDASDACGLGYLMQRGGSSNNMAPFAYSTVNVGCDIGVVTAHEIGHNLGLNHDPRNTTVEPTRAFAPDAYGHNHPFPDNFKTVMSYGRTMDVPYFSNPGIVLVTRPIGIEGERNNSRVLGDTIGIGSRYRTGPVTPPPPVEDPTIAPSDLTVTEVTAESISLAWVDNATDELDVLVEQREAGTAWQQIAVLAADTVTYTATDLTGGTSYDYRVRARTADAISTWSNRATATTLSGPPQPTLLTAEPTSNTAVTLTFQDVDSSDSLRVQRRSIGSMAEQWTSVSDLTPLDSDRLLISGLEPGQPYTFRLLAERDGETSPPSEALSATPGATSGPCTDDDQTLCLLDGRFELRVHWNDVFSSPPVGGVAGASAVAGSSETGTFWFFDPQNVELVSKVLDGRALNDSFWHFFGALSNVEYWVTVRDTEEERQRTYHNEPFDLCGEADINAFPETPTDLALLRSSEESSPPYFGGVSTGALGNVTSGSGTCVEDASTLCLQNGRFAVRVDWQTSSDAGAGVPLADLTTRETGFFWFFSAGNLELAVKVLDGTGINGNFWVFWGGLSDVSYNLTVEDTLTGQSATYSNPAGNFCGGADVNALPGN